MLKAWCLSINLGVTCYKLFDYNVLLRFLRMWRTHAVFCSVERAERGRRWRPNISWATSPECRGADPKYRWEERLLFFWGRYVIHAWDIWDSWDVELQRWNYTFGLAGAETHPHTLNGAIIIIIIIHRGKLLIKILQDEEGWSVEMLFYYYVTFSKECVSSITRPPSWIIHKMQSNIMTADFYEIKQPVDSSFLHFSLDPDLPLIIFLLIPVISP